MEFHEYFEYFDRSIRLAMAPRFKWSGRPAESDPNPTFRRGFFLLASFCLAYQIVGVMTYWLLFDMKEEDTQRFVAGISEATGALMLVSVGFYNVCALSYHRNEIEVLLTHLMKLYPRPGERHYRCRHYHSLANGLMKFEFVYFWLFALYYNGAPLASLLYEHLMDGMEVGYKTQINTWYPWRVHGSAVGYGLGHFATCIGSIVGLKLHFDAIANQLRELDSRHQGARQELRRLIAYHSQVIRIAVQFNEIMNFSFLGGLVFSTIALCMTSVAILLLDLVSAFKCVNGLVAFIVYNFVICFLGTEFSIGMQLEDFMLYQDLVCLAAQLPRFEWNGRRSSAVNQNLARRFIFLFGAVNLIYHNIGCIMYGYFVDGSTQDPIEYLAELATVGAMLGFTTVGTLSLWKILSLKPHIEKLMDDFEELFQHTKKKPYRTRHYYESYTRFIRRLVIFTSLAIAYYNLLPIILMTRELLTEAQDLSYRLQSSTWYPWKIQGSVPGFLVAVVCQAFSCQTNLCVIMFSQFLVSFFGIQLEIHFDGLARQLEAIDARLPTAKEQLKSLITYHNSLFHLADKVNRFFNFMFFISLSISITCMCFLAFSMTMFDLGPALKHMLGLLLFLIYNFCMCRNGTYLIFASDKVLPAAFYNNWYEGDLAYRKMLLILMMRATKPYVWRTYKLAPVSITTYMATLKFSYQMFTCVRSLK
ncbi:putative odorant receptor 69a isoform X2 [Drosophila biarmipes]|uniref:putative odorant receptor 69a isoform X2 n=1 Tax=Drosophila biarmipes TaxID=125945 RepID=UPI0007E749B7|nr:putative odorant receptor 69a isoform X2 [Drosophila biarmipes]